MKISVSTSKLDLFEPFSSIMALARARSPLKANREHKSNLALMVADAAVPSQQVRSSQALARFEKILSGEETREYRQSIGVALPSTEEVLQLTRELEVKASSRRSRYVTRFWNFLGLVQGVTGVVDIIIGGSQSIIACSTWAVVRFTLQVSNLF